ncbi:MAG: site-2 protease family protein, partial [Megasphaera micronuciformis]
MGITLAATVFVFSLIVFVHEAGHFITAKLTGMQVDEFAIGFGPKLYSRKYGETVYSLRIIPLGGFNKIAGMSDEEELNERSFLNKPVLSRLLVISAGALMNFLLAFLLLWGIVFSTGISSVLPDPIVGGIIKNSAAAEAGIE